MGELRVLGQMGDTRLTWDPANTIEVETAKKAFEDYRAKRFAAFRTTKRGTKGEQITFFDPQAEEVLLVPPIAGG